MSSTSLIDLSHYARKPMHDMPSEHIVKHECVEQNVKRTDESGLHNKKDVRMKIEIKKGRYKDQYLTKLITFPICR